MHFSGFVVVVIIKDLLNNILIQKTSNKYKQSGSFDVLNVDLTLSDEWKLEWLNISYFVHQLAVS